MMETVCVAFKAHIGWVNAVAVKIDAQSPTPVRAERVDLLGTDEGEILEPYHVAGGWHGLKRVPPAQDPAAVIRRGKRRQLASAKKRLAAYRDALTAAGWEWQRAVMLTTRAVSHDLAHTLRSHAHIHIAEGEAIRDATRAALGALKIDVADQDEKSILTTASRLLAVPDCDGMMKNLKPSGAKSWSKEERLIALGAWLRRI